MWPDPLTIVLVLGTLGHTTLVIVEVPVIAVSGQLVMVPASTDHINTGHAFVLVFNISSKQSLTELKPIVELINEVDKKHS